MTNRTSALATTSLACLFAITLAGCSSTFTAEPAPTTTETIEPAPAATPTDTATSAPSDTPAATPGTETGGIGDSLAEREAFIKEQQLPLDGSLLVATTDAQKAYIAEQRAYVEANGGTWDGPTESITLALTADACETAILSNHIFDDFTLSAHMGSSPLVAELIPESATDAERAQLEANAASMAVYGMSYMCPDDYPQARQAFYDVYGAWLKEPHADGS